MHALVVNWLLWSAGSPLYSSYNYIPDICVTVIVSLSCFFAFTLHCLTLYLYYQFSMVCMFICTDVDMV